MNSSELGISGFPARFAKIYGSAVAEKEEGRFLIILGSYSNCEQPQFSTVMDVLFTAGNTFTIEACASLLAF